MTVLDEIAAVRQKQIAKGYDAPHDDQHTGGELRFAAASFALRAGRYGDAPVFASLGLAPMRAKVNFGWVGIGNVLWPWVEDFPYHMPVRDRLLAAAALIVAEIERLDRLPADPKEPT